MKLKIVQIALVFVSLLLAYLIYETIQTPVRFNTEKDRRADLVVQNLKDIRSIQQVYRMLNDSFAGNFDVLIRFMKTGKIPVVNIIFDPNDTTLTKTISDTIAFVNVADSLFGRRKDFKPEQIQYIPFSDNQKFELSSGKINKGGVMVPVFMAMAKKEYYLRGLDKEMIKNPKVKDLILGSMTEPTTDGNWE